MSTRYGITREVPKCMSNKELGCYNTNEFVYWSTSPHAFVCSNCGCAIEEKTKSCSLNEQEK